MTSKNIDLVIRVTTDDIKGIDYDEFAGELSTQRKMCENSVYAITSATYYGKDFLNKINDKIKFCNEKFNSVTNDNIEDNKNKDFYRGQLHMLNELKFDLEFWKRE